MSLFPRKNRRNKDGSRRIEPEGDNSAEKVVPRGANRQYAAALTTGYLFGLHRDMASEALRRLIKYPVASLINSLMIAVAFSLPALLFVLVANLEVLSSGWDGQPRISIYLSDKATDLQAQALVTDIRKEPGIESVVYISPADGLQDFQKQAGISNVIDELGFNPLPGVVEITPIAGLSSDALSQLATRYKDIEAVKQVKLDRQWVKRLYTILALLDRVAVTLGCLLGLTVLLVISNTIRLTIESRRDEIRVIKMVGGTNGFIMLPFLYMGMWYGLAGAFLAILVVFTVLAVIVGQVSELAGLYGSQFSLAGPGLYMLSALVLSGIVLGIVGAMVSCYRHLRDLVPE